MILLGSRWDRRTVIHWQQSGTDASLWHDECIDDHDPAPWHWHCEPPACQCGHGTRRARGGTPAARRRVTGIISGMPTRPVTRPATQAQARDWARGPGDSESPRVGPRHRASCHAATVPACQAPGTPGRPLPGRAVTVRYITPP